MTINEDVGPDGIATPHSSGINIIIVGLGIAGLATAIECHRKGHTVIGLEKSSLLRSLGDSIALGSNATRILQRWGQGEFLTQLAAISDDIATMDVLDTSGKLFAADSTEGYGRGQGMIINRGDLFTSIYKYGKELGIDLQLGVAVEEYWEDDDGKKAGVILRGGEKLMADVVVCADGVHSKAPRYILGYAVPSQRSALAVYRASFRAAELQGDVDAQWILKDAGVRDRMWRYLAPNGLGLTLATGKRGKMVVWQLWHEDTNDAAESWANSSITLVEDALTLLQDWPIYPGLASVLRRTPQNRLADYPIIKRPPLPTWISPRGRLILVGDAAHPNIPAAGQGGGQAIEDAATLAICLELGTKDRIKESLQVHQSIRHARNCLVQEGGNAIYDRMRQPAWEEIKKDPSIIMLPRPSWIFDYNAVDDVYDQFPLALRAVKEGRQYKPTNVPEDGKYRFEHDYKAF